LKITVVLIACLLASGFLPAQQGDQSMNGIAEEYVKLVLAVGEHDAGYVDAYYGPEEWREEVRKSPLALEEIKKKAKSLVADLEKIELKDAEEVLVLRKEYLVKQIGALEAYAGMKLGEKKLFDEESRLLYDAVAPHNSASHFQAVIDDLDEILPGEGTVNSRYQEFRSGYVIPKDKLDSVFKAALEESRKRTAKHFDLPDNESFKIEYVTDKPWSGYNWYQGNGHSLIQMNTDFPIYIDRAIDLACHEGYPGHHVYNAMLEKTMVKERGWKEFTVYPLFSPQSLIAEGSANYGIDVAFPEEERVAFERDILFPLAGIDPNRADVYEKVMTLVKKLNYAGNEAARLYLDGEIDADAAAEWLVIYALMSPEKAEQRVRFIDTYRSYVINYNLGKDLVKSYMEKKGGDRWKEFEKLLSSPRLPSGLR